MQNLIPPSPDNALVRVVDVGGGSGKVQNAQFVFRVPSHDKITKTN